MRFFLTVLMAALWLIGPAVASPLPAIKLTSADDALGWMKSYRDRPNPNSVPGIVKQLAAVGAFQEPDGAGVYVGFVAGVLASDANKASSLITKMAAIPAADQWVIVKAIAYSRLTGWRYLMRASEKSLPEKQPMIDAYLTGKLASFDDYRIEDDRSTMDRIRGKLSFNKPAPAVVLEPSPTILDTLWGYYFATGSRDALADIADLAVWSKDRNDAARLSIGSAAKYSLAANASRDAPLLAAIKDVRQSADEDLGPILAEAIFAAETAETAKLRDEAADAINELRTKGPAYQRKVAWWGKAGEGAIALGCLVAAVTAQVQFGIPCVVGGAVTSAALRYFASPN
jgi:hypothetical protein